MAKMQTPNVSGRSWSKAEHGTRARYQKHKRDGEEPCDDCRAGNAAASRAARDGRPAHIADKQKKRAVSLAERRLTHLFPVEFHALYTEELRKIQNAGTEE